MQNERRRRDPFGLFGVGSFGGFGGSTFGRNPFDDPFFTRPFDSVFDQNNPVRESLSDHPQNEPIIRELASDEEEEEEMENKGQGQKSASHNGEPFVDHPDDEPDDIGKQTKHGQTDYNRSQGSQLQTFKVHSCKVSYGGIDGVYYTSSATRKMGNDGVVMEGCKEADQRTGEAAHRISRGLHTKGHSVIRKINSDGKVDTLQTLHNLNKDELGSFEEAWNDNYRRQLSLRSGSSGTGVDQIWNWGEPRLPSVTHVDGSGGRLTTNVNRGNPSSGRPKNVVRISIE